MADGRQHAAAEAFDAIGADYERAFAGSPAHRGSLDRLLARLSPRSRVLDVGSGTGRPTAHTLAAAGHEVLGVDVSPVMVELASRRVPEASFRCADIRELPLEEEGFDAVCVYFSLLQMSRDEQSSLVRRLAGALRPGGHLVLATVPLDVQDVDAVFMGQEVRVTSFGPEAFRAMATGAGLDVVDEERTVFTPDGPGAVPEPHLFLHCVRGPAVSEG
ncbi:class I SAM-dependent methyltransferase [Streptomyces sp. NPDC053741]|uniref:class I SAM-dependent methyltransferase n=1 Tax=Streptomyces TaxID=1883 RepID=UPI0002C6CD04|nr:MULTISPECIES: class I SAM-dependent methyltransferase [Streptomyces]AGJ53216.1 methyltransferase [Streptomyces sp. PAMC 26508]RAS32264.1 methyltransferase family protein [Streptomyces avidinii]TPN21694.1 class I SAM-dependent methyltransferase [Mesorhizobium sp. B2-3-3]SNX76022.1 Methyltransferase domain-containing protein [Streptomyces microflavus]